ncbi:SCO family protein [Bacillus sp. MRMR6]|uniref:SCO family protein n=1 Tax=Bacillus sp. MRMR6 TaxID=1928617 RepID=UPI000951A09B|nr:SCO family protein [Bacillus sp. MRMR6]OLS40423.1 SCO family protein [Bacillus sp. MRMR6]
MINNKPYIISMVVVLLFGIGLFYVGTDGFTAYTAETARVNKLIEDQPKFPQVTLEDSNGRKYDFSEFNDQYVFITFLYTACTTVCPELEYNMAQVYNKIPKEYIGKDITFLSISFDPERDDPATLNKYKDFFNSDGETWRMARIPDQYELNRLLEQFGVIVIPDENGNFAHNSAFYLVDRNGSLVNVMDYTKIDEAAETVVSILEREAGDQ